MQRIIAALFLVIGFASSATAYDNPKALIEAIYSPYAAGQKHDTLTSFYSTRLRDMYAARAERAAIDDTPAADAATHGTDVLVFDPFIEGEHSLLLDLVIGEPIISGERASAVVSFHNFDHRSMISIAMVREGDGWKVDDVASLNGTQNWLLSWLLEFDPFSVN